MEVRCDKCQARYRVDDARIGPAGLTMRCGKCQNTFKVRRPEAAAAPQPAPPAPAAPAAPPAPAAPAAPAAPPVGATQVLAAPKPAPAKPAPAAPAKAAPAGARPAPAKPAAAPAADEAGRTMMFQTGNIKTAPAGKPARLEPEQGMATLVQANPPRHEAKAGNAEENSGSTMVFGQSPLAPPKPQVKTPTPPTVVPAVPKATDEVPGSTMMFGAGEQQLDTLTPATAVRPPTSDPGPGSADAATDEKPDSTQETPVSDLPSGVEADGAEAAPPPAGRFDKAPPKGLLIGVAAGVALVLVVFAAVYVKKKLGLHAPPPAAVEALAAAQADADKDTLASIGAAESKAREALEEAGPKSKFPDGAAAYARIEVQFADALVDQAQEYADRSAREGDDKKKADDDAKSTDFTRQAEAKLKSAIDTAGPAYKVSPESTELTLALADYYRVKRSTTLMNKFLKAAQGASADAARIAFIQGAAAAQEDDGAERAVPKLKEAAAASPQNARVHFRLALAYLALKDEASAAAELKTTLKLSPQHERAKAVLDGLTEHK